MERGISSGVGGDGGSGSDDGGGTIDIIASDIHDTDGYTYEADDTREIDDSEGGEGNGISIPRTRRGHFPLMRLPPELRNHVYSYLLSEPLVINASTMLVPSILHTTSLLRRESLGLVTAVNDMGFTVRRTYCTITQGPVTSSHQHFRENGKIILDTRREKWFEQSQAIFKSIKIRVICICCVDRCIGMIYIDIIDGQIKCGISEAPVPHQCSLTWTFAPILGRLRSLLKDIQERSEVSTSQGRSNLSKFKYGDLEEIARCFRFAG
jgi:hypothetical protein